VSNASLSKNVKAEYRYGDPEHYMHEQAMADHPPEKIDVHNLSTGHVWGKLFKKVFA